MHFSFGFRPTRSFKSFIMRSLSACCDAFVFAQSFVFSRAAQIIILEWMRFLIELWSMLHKAITIVCRFWSFSLRRQNDEAAHRSWHHFLLTTDTTAAHNETTTLSWNYANWRGCADPTERTLIATREVLLLRCNKVAQHTFSSKASD